MRRSQVHSSRRLQLPLEEPANSRLPSIPRFLLSLALGLLFCFLTHAQDSGSAATEYRGIGVTLSVIVHGPAGALLSSPAMVRVSLDSIPVAQAETNNGRAELVINRRGDFTVLVQAAGYAIAQKEVSINVNGKDQVDVYLQPVSASAAGVPGPPLLAPKAKKALDEGLQALAAENLAEAQKHASEAMRLAPGHPDVLYLQGVIFLRQREWSKAQEVLEKATQLDPSHANALAALGMALCNQGKYDTAVAPLEKALELKPASSWDTRWALAKAYYGQARYDQALQMSQAALSSSNGKAPQIELVVAQSLVAVGRYEDAAKTLRQFLREHSDRPEAATARQWLNKLAANGKIHSN